MSRFIQNNWKTLIIQSGSITTITFLIYLSFWWSDFNENSRLQKIIFSETNVLNRSNYTNLLDEFLGYRMSQIDLRKINSLIENHPYVKAARVSKRFPTKIIIEIIEREPIAILQIEPMMLIDNQGYVLPYKDGISNYNLPIMTNFNPDHSLYPQGEKTLSKNVNYSIFCLKQIKESYNSLYQNISEMKMSTNNEMELILSDNPTRIYLGQNQLFTKINTLKQFELELKPNKLSDFSYLDMRYKNQIIAKSRKI